MHPNINTEEGLTFLTLSLDDLMFKAEPNWPKSEIVTATKLLLRFNSFQFGDTCYRKKEGREMGSNFTCIWSILTLSAMEMLVLLPKCKMSIAVFKRNIDDTFAI